MKIKLKDLKERSLSLSKFLNLDLSVVLSFRLKRLVQVVKPELAVIEETQNELIKKYGESRKNGIFEVLPEKKEVYLEESNKFLEEEIELEYTKVQIPLTDEIKLSALDMSNLEIFVDFVPEIKRK